jgi:hypothetical protein
VGRVRGLGFTELKAGVLKVNLRLQGVTKGQSMLIRKRVTVGYGIAAKRDREGVDDEVERRGCGHAE